MTPAEVQDVIILQKQLGYEWEHGCNSGRVILTPTLVRRMFEFYAYLRHEYEDESETADSPQG